MQEIRENTSFVLAKVCKANRGHVGALLAEHGLHIGQEMLLVELWQDDGLRSGELATSGVRRASAHRDVGVLGDVERVSFRAL